MGYANPAQLTAGIHTRQYSRAFVIGDENNRVVFVSIDAAMMDQIVKTEVGKRVYWQNGFISPPFCLFVSFLIGKLQKGKYFFFFAADFHSTRQ